MEEKFIRTDKIFHHPDRLLAFKEGRLVEPVTVEIHLSNICNCRCYYCSFKKKHDRQLMSEEEAQIVIYKLKSMGVKGLTFSGGGEPTVHKKILDIMAFAKSLDLNLGLITNGIIFDGRFLQYLDWIRFSLDAPDVDSYRQIKGVNKFDTVISNIEKAVKYKNDNGLNTTIGIQMVITIENYTQILWVLTIAESLNVDYFQFRPCEGMDYPEGIINVVETIKNELLNGRNNKIAIINSWYKWKELQEAEGYKDCPGADFIGAVDAYGNFYICCHHVGDKSACYGNLLATETPEDILFARHSVQRNFDYSKCPIACRGAVINRRLANYKNIEHVNFL